MSLVIYGDKKPTWAAVHQPVLLTGQSNGRRINNRHHLFNVLGYEAVEQMFITILKYKLHLYYFLRIDQAKEACQTKPKKRVRSLVWR